MTLNTPLRVGMVEGQICVIDKGGRIRAMCLDEATAAAIVERCNASNESPLPALESLKTFVAQQLRDGASPWAVGEIYAQLTNIIKKQSPAGESKGPTDE